MCIPLLEHPKLEYDNRLKSVQNIRAGTSMILNIDFDAVPQPSVEWFLNNSSLSSSNRVNIEYSDSHTTLTVKNCNRDDAGKYTLKVRNKAGTATADFEVEVRGKPEAPSNLEVTKFDKDHVVLAWQSSPDDGGAALTGYQVEKRDASRMNWVSVGRVSPEKTGFKVDRLWEGSEYYFRVAAENSVGISDWAELPKPVTAKLPYDEPDCPTKVRIADVSKNSVRLTWQAPKNDGGSPIIGYMVEQRVPRSNRWTKANRQMVKDTEFEYLDLSEGDEFEFHVIAINDAGFSKPSDKTQLIKIKNPFEKPGAPGQPQIADITADQATISWTKPSDDGGSPITNYKIEMRTVGAYRWDLVNPLEKCKGTRYTVSNLLEETDYEFRVSAENKAGTGQPSQASRSAKYGKYCLIES